MPLDYRILLAILGFAAFVTQLSFIPTIKNNIGPFELAGGLLIALFPISARTAWPLQHPPFVKVLAAILCVGAISQINIPNSREATGAINVIILAFLYLFLLVASNLIRQYQVSPERILLYVCRALLLVGPWIIYQGFSSSEVVQEVGPFRNRAHMASYMLTAFWMALMLSQWPTAKKHHRILAYGGVAVTLYAVAVSGRRSVYLSLFLGLLALGAAFLLAQRGKRTSFLVASAFALLLLGAMYQYGPRYLPQLAFFQERVGMIDDRLDQALGVSESEARDQSFFSLQKEGVRTAFAAHPFIGIGWGGFARSHYSPTGHEVHSTPLRFLAETGLAGVLLYALFLFALVRSVVLSFLRTRGTPYANAFLVLGVGLCSMIVSYLYNRHITERTFWLLLVVIAASEYFAGRLRQREPRRPGPRLEPIEAHTRQPVDGFLHDSPRTTVESWPASSS